MHTGHSQGSPTKPECGASAWENEARSAVWRCGGVAVWRRVPCAFPLKTVVYFSSAILYPHLVLPLWLLQWQLLLLLLLLLLSHQRFQKPFDR
eukprot:COSAG06_NODE_2904_length_6116_cov_6.924713_2_plen_93_part_00